MTRPSRLLLGWIAGIVLLIALSTVIAQAQEYTETVTFRWENPTQYVNGQPLPLGEIESIILRCASSPSPQAIATSSRQVAFEPSPPESQWGLPEGQNHCRAWTLGTNGEISAMGSNIVSRPVIVDPDAPSDLLIWQPLTGPIYVSAEDDGAYAITQADDRITPLWVGTFPVGTECDPTQGFNGMYLVPKALADVDLNDDGEDDSDAATLVARCVSQD